MVLLASSPFTSVNVENLKCVLGIVLCQIQNRPSNWPWVPLHIDERGKTIEPGVVMPTCKPSSQVPKAGGS